MQLVAKVRGAQLASARAGSLSSMVTAVAFAVLTSSLTGPVDVCIDPGHTSEVGSGAKGRKLSELQLVWELAVAMKLRLTRQGYRVTLTKHSLGEKVTNRTRADRANRHNARLMVRLHADAGNSSGITTYYPDRQAKSQGHLGPPHTVLQSSKVAATAFHAATKRVLDGHHRDGGLKTDRQTAIGSKQGALTGSIFSEVPVLLVETCVITNPQDEAFVSSPEGREKLIQALVTGTVHALDSLKSSR